MISKDIKNLIYRHSLVNHSIKLKETTWFNSKITNFEAGLPYVGLITKDIKKVCARLVKFASYLCKVFTEAVITKGMIESDIIAIFKLQAILKACYHANITNNLLVKKEHYLPCSGSIKARDDIYKELIHAEKLFIGHGL